MAFAETVEVSPRAYASYELGERDLPFNLIKGIYAKYHVSADWLLFGEGSRNPEERAAIAAGEFLDAKNVSATPEKIAKTVRHLFKYHRKNGEITEEYRDDYMSSAI